MNHEKIKNEVRLSELKRAIMEIRTKLTNLRQGLRSELDPFDPVDAINGQVVASLALELAAQQTKLLEALGQAEAVRKALES